MQSPALVDKSRPGLLVWQAFYPQTCKRYRLLLELVTDFRVRLWDGELL